MHIRESATCAMLLTLALTMTAMAQAPMYELTDLHDILPAEFDAKSSRALGVNDHGIVVGSFVRNTDECPVIVLWDTMTDTAETAVDDPSCGIEGVGQGIGEARAINNNDQIVGYHLYADNGQGCPCNKRKAVLWDRTTGMITDLLPDPSDPQAEYAAFDINDSGQIVGKRAGPDRALYWDAAVVLIEGDIEQLSCPDVTTEWSDPRSALGLNESGVIVGGTNAEGLTQCVGSGGTQEGAQPLFKWSAADGFSGLCNPCQGPGCNFSGPEVCYESEAFEVNDDGAMVGGAVEVDGGEILDTRVAWYLAPDLPGEQLIYLGRLEGDDCSKSLAINNDNFIVGVSGACDTADWGEAGGVMGNFGHYQAQRSPFLYIVSNAVPGIGVMYNLQDHVTPLSVAGLTLVEASDINNDGQIVGWAVDADGDDHAYILTPLPPSCPGDCDYDGLVDMFDLLILLASWGMGGCPDLDDSGAICINDLLVLLEIWGPCL